MINSKVQMAGRYKRLLPTAGNEIFLMEREKKKIRDLMAGCVFFFFFELSSLIGFADTNITQIIRKWGLEGEAEIYLWLQNSHFIEGAREQPEENLPAVLSLGYSWEVVWRQLSLPGGEWWSWDIISYISGLETFQNPELSWRLLPVASVTFTYGCNHKFQVSLRNKIWTVLNNRWVILKLLGFFLITVIGDNERKKKGQDFSSYLQLLIVNTSHD